MMPFAFFQNIGTTELLIVAFVSLLVFGNRLPSVMRSLGKSVTEFKKGVAGIEDEIDQAVTADKDKDTDQLPDHAASRPTSTWSDGWPFPGALSLRRAANRHGTSRFEPRSTGDSRPETDLEKAVCSHSLACWKCSS